VSLDHVIDTGKGTLGLFALLLFGLLLLFGFAFVIAIGTTNLILIF